MGIMLLLPVLLATSFWSPPSQTPALRRQVEGSSASMACRMSSQAIVFDGTVIHWYQQKEGKAPERLLYYSGGKASVESGFQADRYMIETVSSQNRCVFTIKDVIPDDAATYYCAYWDPHCDRNSKIIKAKNPPPSTSEPQGCNLATPLIFSLHVVLATQKEQLTLHNCPFQSLGCQ
uniref:Ig-like domain-containing protein n=1 Tax=Bubo bubo TaxID=30461 RepID=A0A8C0IFU9_BUBBB